MNPFDELKKPGEQDLETDEWQGQFSCATYRCDGWANIARYYKKQRILAWKCQEGHVSTMEDVDE